MPEHKPLVLIADDEQNAVRLLTRVLERDGYEVASARDGLSALEKARELLPDLILLDVQMPHLNGFEVTARLREDPATARIPVIFVTAAAREASDVAHGLQLGADDYIRKPYDYYELIARATSKMRARKLEDRLQRRSEELEALVRIGADLNRRLSLNALTELILLIVRDELQAPHVALILLDKHQQPIVYRDLTSGFHSTDNAHAILAHENTFVHEVFVTDTPHLTADIVAEYGDAEYLVAQGYNAALATPLRHDDQLIGILIAAHPEPGHFPASRLRMLRSIGEQAALAVRNAQLHDALQEHAHHLESRVEERTQALRRTQAQLVQSEKLAALGRLAAGIAHEVNNPLQPILNCLEGALEDVANEDPIDPESLRIAESEVQRIKGIVARLLDFARPGSGETLEMIHLAGLIQEVLVLVNKQLERMRVNVKTRFEPVSPIQGAPAQLKQVLLNLILNAMESMPNGGLITIEMKAQGDGVALNVIDTGIGMDGDALSHIFEPFYSTKGDGTGLGLSVTYGIIQGHGGDIHVTSTLGEGSCFGVWLPFKRPEVVTPSY
ncbi:MAG: response regulator [Anaerolineae bacterium]|nr:response regulator [Anaerolineae bacterium]